MQTGQRQLSVEMEEHQVGMEQKLETLATSLQNLTNAVNVIKEIITAA